MSRSSVITREECDLSFDFIWQPQLMWAGRPKTHQERGKTGAPGCGEGQGHCSYAFNPFSAGESRGWVQRCCTFRSNMCARNTSMGGCIKTDSERLRWLKWFSLLLSAGASAPDTPPVPGRVNTADLSAAVMCLSDLSTVFSVDQ